MEILKVDNLSIQFGGLRAVDQFEITVNDNELVGLIGPNGAGKTTIFNLLTGVYAPTEGEIYVNGTSTKNKKPNEIVKLGSSRTFQNIRLFKNMTVLDNIKVAYHNQMSYKFISSIIKNSKYRKEEAKAVLNKVDKMMHESNFGYGLTSRGNLHNRNSLLFLEACYLAGDQALIQKVSAAVKKDLEQRGVPNAKNAPIAAKGIENNTTNG